MKSRIKRSKQWERYSSSVSFQCQSLFPFNFELAANPRRTADLPLPCGLCGYAGINVLRVGSLRSHLSVGSSYFSFCQSDWSMWNAIRMTTALLHFVVSSGTLATLVVMLYSVCCLSSHPSKVLLFKSYIHSWPFMESVSGQRYLCLSIRNTHERWEDHSDLIIICI